MRRTNLTAWVLLAATALVAACSQKEPKTVAYYAANPTERAQVVAACKDNPGKLKDDPDCTNANDAAIQSWGKGTLPPVNFGGPAPAPAASATASQPAR